MIMWQNDPVLQEKILKILKEKGTLSRDQICKELGFERYLGKDNRRRYKKRTNVYNNLKVLERTGIIKRTIKRSSRIIK